MHYVDFCSPVVPCLRGQQQSLSNCQKYVPSNQKPLKSPCLDQQRKCPTSPMGPSKIFSHPTLFLPTASHEAPTRKSGMLCAANLHHCARLLLAPLHNLFLFIVDPALSCLICQFKSRKAHATEIFSVGPPCKVPMSIP